MVPFCIIIPPVVPFINTTPSFTSASPLLVEAEDFLDFDEEEEIHGIAKTIAALESL